MVESTQLPGSSLLEQPILAEPLIPSVFVGHDYEKEEFDAALAAAFAEYNDATQIPALLKKYECLAVGSDANSDGFTSLLSPSRPSFSGQDGRDGNENGENECQGDFFLPTRGAQHMFDNIYPENTSIDRTHPALRQSFIPSFMMENHGPYRDAQVYFRAFGLSHHDGPFDTRSPTIAAQVSPFAAEIDQFGPGSTSSTSSIHPVDAPGNRLRSTVDFLGGIGGNDEQALRDAHFYLKFTDDFRETLNNGVDMYDDELDMLSTVLEEIIAREEVGKNPMPFSIIVFARLEKLLKSLVDHPGQGQHATRPNLRNAIHLAVTLQRKWQMRFKDKLFHTDRDRILHMVMYGLLAHVNMKPSPNGDGSAEWVAERPWPTVGADLINFQIGQWWPTIVCALRDGVLDPTGNKNLGSHQFVTYVALLEGVEIFDPETGCMIYEFEGKLEKIFVYLQDKVGKNIRLLRGYKLKSGNAPKLGIRFDGNHMLRRYSLKLFDTNKQFYRLMLYYDAVKGESGIDKDFIKPSVLDDWQLYKKIENAEMRKYCSKERYYEWQAEEESEVKAVQEWHRQQKFREQARDLNT